MYTWNRLTDVGVEVVGADGMKDVKRLARDHIWITHEHRKKMWWGPEGGGGLGAHEQRGDEHGGNL